MHNEPDLVCRHSPIDMVWSVELVEEVRVRSSEGVELMSCDVVEVSPELLNLWKNKTLLKATI